MTVTLLCLLSFSLAFNIKASHSGNFTFGTLVFPGAHKCSYLMKKQLALYFWKSLYSDSFHPGVYYAESSEESFSCQLLYSTVLYSKRLWPDSLCSPSIISSILKESIITRWYSCYLNIY